MPNANINGVVANVNRINLETLSADARVFLRDFRTLLREKKSINTEVSRLVAQSIIKYHNKTGEDIEPFIVEIVTAAIFAISPLWQFIPKLATYFILGITYGLFSITEDKEEIKSGVEQAIVAFFTNPVYEFSTKDRKKFAEAVLQVDGYINMANLYSATNKKIFFLSKSLITAIEDGYSICQASQVELKHFKGLNYWWLAFLSKYRMASCGLEPKQCINKNKRENRNFSLAYKIIAIIKIKAAPR